MIRIVTDSTCDLPAELLAQHRITVVPINIQFGQESYQERVTLDSDTFYSKVEEHHRIPTTSQPSLGQFQAAYRTVRDEPDTEGILSMHITGHLSGTCEAAVIAAGQMPQDPPITVFDTLSGSMGLGFMILEAAALAEAGAALAAILARLEALRERMHIFFSLNDLRYARMSGRVGMSQALMASLLQIKPLLTVREGKLDMVKRVRSRAQGLHALVDALSERLGDLPARVAVIHAQAPEAAEQVRAALAARSACPPDQRSRPFGRDCRTFRSRHRGRRRLRPMTPNVQRRVDMLDRPVSTLPNGFASFSAEPQHNLSSGQPGAPGTGAILPLGAFLALARELAALVVPVHPRAGFRLELQRNLEAAARRQVARDLLLYPPSAGSLERGGRRWVWGAATLGSAVSLASIVAYVWLHRHREAA